MTTRPPSRRKPPAKRLSSPSTSSHQAVWAKRLSFFRRSVMIDGICPVAGLGIIGYQTAIQSGLLLPYVIAAGLIGLPGIARLTGILGGGR